MMAPGFEAGMDQAASRADALIVDLAGGDAADATALLRALAAADPRPALLVRVRPLDTEFADADLDAAMGLRPDGIVLPRVRGGVDLQRLGVKLAVREAEHGLAEGSVGIVAMIDTASGVFGLESLSASTSRLAALAWDAASIAQNFGAAVAYDEQKVLIEPCRTARSLVVFAAAAAGVPAIDTARAGVDIYTFSAGCRAARRDGFKGALAHSPEQVAAARAVFLD